MLTWNVFSVCGFADRVQTPVEIDHRGVGVTVTWVGEVPKRVRHYKGVPRIWLPTISSGICQGLVFVPKVLATPGLKGRALPHVRR